MKKFKVLTLLVLLLSFAFVLMACGGNGEETTSDLVARGKEVVANNCIGCHALEGESQGISLAGLGEVYTKDELNDILENGIGEMPGGTADGEEDAVVEYLLTLD